MERDRDQALLRPVVQVSLDATAFLVAGRDDPRTRLGQFSHRLAQVGDVADDRDDLVAPAGDDAGLEILERAVDGPQPVVRGRERARLERRSDRAHQGRRDGFGEDLDEGAPDDLVGRVGEP